MTPKLVECPECLGTGQSPRSVGYVSCWWCEGFGMVPDTDPAVRPDVNYIPCEDTSVPSRPSHEAHPAQ